LAGGFCLRIFYLFSAGRHFFFQFFFQWKWEGVYFLNGIMDAMAAAFTPLALLLNTFGVVLGIIFGALPGLNGVVGVAMLLPLTYGFSPVEGLVMLAGMYTGATYGGAISGILINCPGTGEAACTAINGNLLQKAGRGKEALLISIISSTIGGLFGAVVLLLFTPTLSKWALKFGYSEMFLISLAGLTVVGSLLGKSVSKGFFSVSVGLVFAITGMDTVSTNFRFTFHNMNLQAGVNLVAACVGFFAISEMLENLTSLQKKEESSVKSRNYGVMDAVAECVCRWKLTLKSCIIGTIIGIIPGTGGAISSFIAYGEAKRSTKEPEQFAKNEGSVDGIIGPQAANNAVIGGSFVPLLVLGIPGSSTSAIIYGALTIHSLIPGPQLFNKNTDIVYALMAGVILGVVIMAVAGITLNKVFEKILTVDMKYIIPAVMAFSIVGAYSARNNIFDILVAICLGVIGIFFKKAEIPIAPCILGMVLGNLTESNLRRAMTVAGAKNMSLFSYVMTRPLSIVVVLLVGLLIYTNVRNSLREQNAE
jgi:putative tricarboxylic transport membrane protein